MPFYTPDKVYAKFYDDRLSSCAKQKQTHFEKDRESAGQTLVCGDLGINHFICPQERTNYTKKFNVLTVDLLTERPDSDPTYLFGISIILQIFLFQTLIT